VLPLLKNRVVAQSSPKWEEKPATPVGTVLKGQIVTRGVLKFYKIKFFDTNLEVFFYFFSVQDNLVLCDI